jgi:glutathione S-transferase
MPLQLYYNSISPPARAVLLTVRSLGLRVDVQNVNLLAGEHLTSKFLKLNPAHQIPVLVDDDFVLSESRSIMAYLVNSRKSGSELYPVDSQKRARIDQRMYFDATTVFERNAAAIVS